VQFLNEIKEHVNAGFQWATNQGPLCGEPVRGCVFKLLDAALHTDSIHRGMGQIMPCARSVVYACIYTAEPTLQEPMFLADVSVPVDESGGVYGTLSMRRGIVIEDNPRAGTPLTQIKAHVPVSESIGLDKELRKATGGKAFSQCAFSHWQAMSGDVFAEVADPSDDNNKSLAAIVQRVRIRKGNKATLPPLSQYLDKL